MEIVNIEARTFEKMLSTFESFANRVESLCQLYGCKDIGEWYDTQDVCQLFKISPRTLQTLRDNGALAYSKINSKYFYKPQDVEKILPLVEHKRRKAARKNSSKRLEKKQ